MHRKRRTAYSKRHGLGDINSNLRNNTYIYVNGLQCIKYYFGPSFVHPVLLRHHSLVVKKKKHICYVVLLGAVCEENLIVRLGRADLSVAYYIVLVITGTRVPVCMLKDLGYASVRSVVL
jgi:hypothetical protein